MTEPGLTTEDLLDESEALLRAANAIIRGQSLDALWILNAMNDQIISCAGYMESLAGTLEVGGGHAAEAAECRERAAAARRGLTQILTRAAGGGWSHG